MEQKRSGQYKKAKKAGYKVAGLTAEQSKRATTLKGKKVSAGQLKKANVLKDIGTTRWEKGKGVVGPGGKAFTGSVILASGKTATYVKGRRVGVQTKGRAAGGSGGRTGTGPPPPPPPSGGKPVSGTSRKARAAMQKGRPNWQSGAARPPAAPKNAGLTSAQRSKLQKGRKTFKSGSFRPTHRNPVASWWSNTWSTPRAWSGGPQPQRKLK